MEVVGRTWSAPDGLTLFARDYAAADGAARLPVVCIHGLTRNSRDFEAVAPAIAAQGRRVLAVDVRGRGRSAFDPEPANYHPGTYAGDVAALLDQLGVGRAVFVGTSMGGIITMVLAASRPELTAGAVLNDVGPKLSPVGLGRIGGYVGQAPAVETWADAAAYARAINGVAFPSYGEADWDAFARRLFHDEGGRPVLDYDPDIAAPFRDADPTAAPADMTALFRALTNDRPVLLVRGALSDLIDAALATEMRALAPAMAYAEVAGVGHAPMLTEPEARAALEAFLAAAP